MFSIMPKYRVLMPLTSVDPLSNEKALNDYFAPLGFRNKSSKGSRETPLVFVRGGGIGAEIGGSINNMKVVIKVKRPVQNPAVLEVKYGALFGVGFDTGDLWRFCGDLLPQVYEAEDELSNEGMSQQPKSDNPYQSPPT